MNQNTVLNVQLVSLFLDLFDVTEREHGGPNSPPYLRHTDLTARTVAHLRAAANQKKAGLNGGLFLNCEMWKARASSGVRY